MLHIEFLVNRFLLERIPPPRPNYPTATITPPSKKPLINTSLEILNVLSTFLYSRADRADHFAAYFPWALVYAGLPAASVLSVELLKQTWASSPSGCGPGSFGRVQYELELPRADVVQNLSVFVVALHCLDRTHGNYRLCHRMRKAVQRVLKEALEGGGKGYAAMDGSARLNGGELDERSVGDDLEGRRLSAPGGGRDSTLQGGSAGYVLGPMEEAEFTEWLLSLGWTSSS